MGESRRVAAWQQSKKGPDHTVRLYLTWNPQRKTWILTTIVRVAQREVAFWRTIDTTAALDMDSACMISEAIAREMESWLF